MKTTRWICLSAMLFGLSWFPGISAEPHPPIPDEHLELLREAFHLTATMGEEIWPGFTGKGAPVLLVVGEVEYLLGVEQQPDGFSMSPGRKFRGRHIYTRDRVLPENLLATFPAIGFNVIVVGTPDATNRNPAHWVLTMAHEMFHILQGERGLDGRVMKLEIGAAGDSDWHMNFPFPYENPDVRNAMHLLGFNLFRAAEMPDADLKDRFDYEARAAGEALSNLFAILELRFGDERAANYFRYQATKEGVARYVEYRMAEAAAGESYEPTRSFLKAHGKRAYREILDSTYSRKMLYQIKHAGNVSKNRVEFYGLGLGLALTLDRLGPENWKRHYFDEGVWIDSLLADALVAGSSPDGCGLGNTK
jgi:hypothetical protein